MAMTAIIKCDTIILQMKEIMLDFKQKMINTDGV